MNVDVISLLHGRQDRLEERIEAIEEKVDGVPELRKSVDRLTNAIYTFICLLALAAASWIIFGPAPPA